MPTYEYRCQECREVTEAIQKMSDAALTTCPQCGKDALQRIVSGGAGVLYKGEGWYVTDYSKKSSGGKESSSESGEKSGTKSGDSKGSDSTGEDSKGGEKKSPSETKSSEKSESSTTKPAETKSVESSPKPEGASSKSEK